MNEIPGIKSILYQPATEVWPGEVKPEPDSEIVSLFEAAREAIPYPSSRAKARKLLDKLALCRLQPSQQMRLHYLQAEFLSMEYDFNQAHKFYDMALQIATNGEDADSMIVLSMNAGLMRYGKLRNRDALAYYQHALDVCRARSITPPHPRLDPEIMILTYLGQPQWLVGQLDEAHGTLARALGLALFQRGAPRDEYLRKSAASALWTLALVLRSQSDMNDGDARLINTALTRAHKAIGLYESIGTLDSNMARFRIQIAELYLDLAELHLQRGAKRAASQSRNEAFNHLTEADNLLSPDADQTARLLMRLTRTRHAITRPLTRAAARTLPEIEATFIQIEREAAAIGDQFISAKSATLRGEWLLWLGDNEAAREALQLALDGFAGDGMGMATRAQRLLRRIPPASDPGGQWRPSNGPAPTPLTPTPPAGDDRN